MALRDTAAIVLNALGCPMPNTYQARVPSNLFNNYTAPTKYSFGLTDKGVTVNGDSYEIEMYIEGADNRFGHDAWFGIYDGNVTAEDLYAQGGALSQGAWDYVAQSSSQRWTTTLSAGSRLGASRRTFTFKSSNLDTAKTSSNPAVGGTYTIFLFYTDGHDGNGYVVADSICVTIGSSVNTSASFGLTENGVKVRPDGTFTVEMYLEGATNFRYDTWVGMYDADVTAENLKSSGQSLSQGAWSYVKSQNDLSDLSTTTRYVFTLDSRNFDSNKENVPTTGKTYNIYLFPTDGFVSGDNRKYDAVECISVHIPSVSNTGTDLKFGFVNDSNKIIVNADGSWSLNMFIEGADERFEYDAWYGIKDELLSKRGLASQGAWDYIDSSLESGTLGSSRKTFTFNSSKINSDASNPPILGGNYNLVLFYNDRSPNGYVVAEMIPFTLPTPKPVSFNLTEKGVFVSPTGAWTIEMYLEGADNRFAYDAWFGIYDTSVTAQALLQEGKNLSKGAWDYVVQGNGLHEPGLPENAQLGADRIVFTFSSLNLTPAANPNPTLGGNYKVFLFYTDGYAGNAYSVAAQIDITIPTDPSHIHLPVSLDYNETSHWETCSCGEILNVAEHDFTYEEDYNDTHHWGICECKAISPLEEHDFSDGDECSCGAEKPHVHVAEEYSYNDTHHWGVCECGQTLPSEEHDFTNSNTCICGANKPHVHTPVNTYHNATHHWGVCECGQALPKVEHDFANGDACECGYEKEETPAPDNNNNNNNNENNDKKGLGFNLGCNSSIGGDGSLLFSVFSLTIIACIIFVNRAKRKKS